VKNPAVARELQILSGSRNDCAKDLVHEGVVAEEFRNRIEPADSSGHHFEHRIECNELISHALRTAPVSWKVLAPVSILSLGPKGSGGLRQSLLIEVLCEDLVAVPVAFVEPQMTKAAKIRARCLHASVNRGILQGHKQEKAVFVPVGFALEVQRTKQPTLRPLLHGHPCGQSQNLLESLVCHLVVLIVRSRRIFLMEVNSVFGLVRDKLRPSEVGDGGHSSVPSSDAELDPSSHWPTSRLSIRKYTLT